MNLEIQEKFLKMTKKIIYHLKDSKLIQIKEFPNALLSNEGDGDYALIS